MLMRMSLSRLINNEDTQRDITILSIYDSNGRNCEMLDV